MAPASVFQLLILSCLLCALPAFENEFHLFVVPQSPMLVMGSNFTATCVIINTTEVTADDLYWSLSTNFVPKEQYTKINRTALNVTLPVTSEKSEWLTCQSKGTSPYVVLNMGQFIHGVYLRKGYFPEKPQNLTCVVKPEKKGTGGIISCVWDPVGRQTTSLPTTYKLIVNFSDTHVFNIAEPDENRAEVRVSIIPFHMPLDILVEAKNGLGAVESELLLEDVGKILKTDPPSDVRVNSEKNFSESLLITWNPSIKKIYTNLIYKIRYCPYGSHSWTYVPHNETGKDIQSFRLQNLQPDTVYVTQICCKTDKEGNGYWSDWSINATKRTPEDRPSSKPDLWRIISEDNGVNKQVKIICKDPVFANGRIRRFNIQLKDPKNKNKNGSWESVQVNRSEDGYSPSQREITELKGAHLPDKQVMEVRVTATNSEGTSPEASLVFSDRADVFPPVKELKVWPQAGQLWLEWTPPNTGKVVSEYVVEWVNVNGTDWQRESGGTTYTAIKGKLEKFVCYNVSVYPIYSRWIGKQASKEAFLEQAAPLVGPIVGVKGKPGRSSAELVWEEIPKQSQQGFITNYTIFYTSGNEEHAIVVPANVTSYTLTSLERSTKYDIWVKASTFGGSINSSHHTFSTLKYDPGQIEGIVVGVCLGFLFVFLLTMLLCVYKKDVIKENFWPQIPNPGESTIGNWSPNYPLKAETPKENCLSGISVLDVDVCDAKCVFEDDKASLPLKKDKYMSEEHSSGIGGSSCMSSPRQSVSDSDEGGDMADTTASTVQYSSVVASKGYKGQTPSVQPHQAFFSRSESTQPLLDSEENSDMFLQESRRMPCFTQTAESQDGTNPADFQQLEMEKQEVLKPLEFLPIQEDSDQTVPRDRQSAEWLPAASASSYMPQLGGYRPQ